MMVNPLLPDVARKEADRCRKLLLTLSGYEAEEIANHIAQCVSAYGEVNERIEELKLPELNKTKAQAKASCMEHNALVLVQQDKAMTTYQADSMNSTATTLGLMNGGEFAGQPIDLIAYKEAMQRQMDDLVASGAERESRIAQFVITTQKAAERLMLESTTALTLEASALTMKSAVTCMEKAVKMLATLDAMTAPKSGRIVDGHHIRDSQINDHRMPEGPCSPVKD